MVCDFQDWAIRASSSVPPSQWEKSTTMLWGHSSSPVERPLWWRNEDTQHQPTPPCQPCKWATSLMCLLALVKSSDDSNPPWHLTENSWETPRQNSLAMLLLNLWPSETERYEIIIIAVSHYVLEHFAMQLQITHHCLHRAAVSHQEEPNAEH